MSLESYRYPDTGDASFSEFLLRLLQAQGHQFFDNLLTARKIPTFLNGHIPSHEASANYPALNLDRFPTYSAEQLRALVEYHSNIAEWYGVQNSYTEICLDEGRPELLHIEENYRGMSGVSYTAGSVGNFSKLQMAAIVQEQTRIYMKQGTMGTQFPSHDTAAVEQLLAVMIDCSATDLQIAFSHATSDEKFVPLSGARLMYGQRNESIAECNAKGISTLPTLQSLHIDQSRWEDSGLVRFGSTPEYRVVCAGRFFGQTQEVISQLGIVASKLAAHVLSQMPGMYSGIGLQPGAHSPEWMIFDTHDPSIVKMMERFYKAVLIGRDEQVTAREEVLQTILRHHYGDRQRWGGFSGPKQAEDDKDIIVMAVPTDTFQLGAEKLLR